MQMGCIDTLHTRIDRVIPGPGDDLISTSCRRPQQGHTQDGCQGQAHKTSLHGSSPLSSTGSVRRLDSPPMTNLDEQGRPEPPLAADETATLLGFLEYQRATLAWKCGGLDAAGLRATIGASSMTLGGLLKHLAYVEEDWFSRWLHGRDRQPPWDTVDWKADPDWDWHSAADDTPEQLLALWQDAVARSRSRIAEALADGGLERLGRRTWPDGRAPSLRWILCHMIEEYARHNGHADLLRESVDGSTGE